MLFNADAMFSKNTWSVNCANTLSNYKTNSILKPFIDSDNVLCCCIPLLPFCVFVVPNLWMLFIAIHEYWEIVKETHMRVYCIL